MIRIDKVLYEIRKTDGNPFALSYVRSVGKRAGSVGSGEFLFRDFIDTRRDEIKLLNTKDQILRTIKISHLVTFNNQPIKH